MWDKEQFDNTQITNVLLNIQICVCETINVNKLSLPVFWPDVTLASQKLTENIENFKYNNF